MTLPVPGIAADANIVNPYLELFTLDCSNIGGSIYYFIPTNWQAGFGAIYWQGHNYIPMPITSTGWEVKSDGTQAKPTLTLAILNNSAILSAIKSLGDIVGAKVIRYRTFRRYTDGGSSPDPNAYFPADYYLVEQKTAHTNEFVTWTLTSILDRFGILLPRRQILRDRSGGGDPTARAQGFPGVSRYRGPR